MDNILDLIVDYSKRGKLVDLDFLKTVREILIRKKSLAGYVSKIGLAPNLSVSYKENCGGYYDADFREIVMCENNIEEFYRKLENRGNDRLSEYEKFLLANVLETQCVFHEFEHANQRRKIDFENNFEALLLKTACSFELFFSKEILKGHDDEKLFYEYFRDSHYQFMPNERLAENYSWIEVYKMMRPIFGEIHPQIERYMKHCIRKSMIRAYDENNLEPTENYLFDYNLFFFSEPNQYFSVEFYKALEAEKENSLENRLFFGLGITESEFNKYKVKKIEK